MLFSMFIKDLAMDKNDRIANSLSALAEITVILEDI